MKLTDFEASDSAQWDRLSAVTVKGIWLCSAAVMLLSDLAACVSGQTIVVDGGHIMY